ncbi:hypothetical protein BH10ACI1_BH10ACI1_18010 [soil metagenome]
MKVFLSISNTINLMKVSLFQLFMKAHTADFINQSLIVVCRLAFFNLSFLENQFSMIFCYCHAVWKLRDFPAFAAEN